MRPSLYLHPWLRTVFAFHLPIDCATRIFDIFVLEGDSALFRVALAVLQSMEARLFNPDKDELRALFRGEDKGAIAVISRDRDKDSDATHVDPDEVYVQCGATEEAIFAALNAMAWKETTWTRIVARELPD